jgi:hypothetical protein
MKFLFSKRLVTILFVAFLLVAELISCQFSICFFLDLFVLAFCFCLTRRGHGKPPTPNLPTPKVHLSGLNKQPKEEITRYPVGEYPKLDSFFGMGKSKMHMRKGKN